MPKYEKIERPKTLKIEETVLKKLQLLKYQGGYTNYSDTIENILKWYEWWIQPGPGRKQGDGYDQSKK